MKVTDTLSRASLQDNTPEISDKVINCFVHFVMSSLPINEKSRQKLVTERTKDDPQQKLHQISAGWPEHHFKFDPCLRPYHHHNSMISYQDGILFMGQQIIVPSILRLEMHKIPHQGHLGIEKQSHKPDNHSFGQT